MNVVTADVDANAASDPAPAAGQGSSAKQISARLIDATGTGLAVVDPRTWSIRYENASFRAWFPRADDERRDSLVSRVPSLDPVRARERAGRNRPYRIETESSTGPRATPLLLELRREATLPEPLLLVEAVNITKQKEAEYMLDSYSKLMERQARALEQEKERAERLLLNIMPRSVAAELRDFGTTTPQSFESASVLMLDFINFTDMAISRDPGALVAELNDVFTSFDRIMEHSRCERIKTIGDGYMAVAGMPEPNPDHAFNIAHAALRMRRFMVRRNGSAPNRWQCRIGIGHGPVIGSIVGVQKFVYDIFGPAVNMAARLEALCDPMQILITADQADRIRDDFVVRSLGRVEIKGFGDQEIYALEDLARPGR
jgi:adenylate cyclase